MNPRAEGLQTAIATVDIEPVRILELRRIAMAEPNARNTTVSRDTATRRFPYPPAGSELSFAPSCRNADIRARRSASGSDRFSAIAIVRMAMQRNQRIAQHVRRRLRPATNSRITFDTISSWVSVSPFSSTLNNSEMRSLPSRSRRFSMTPVKYRSSVAQPSFALASAAGLNGAGSSAATGRRSRPPACPRARRAHSANGR